MLAQKIFYPFMWLREQLQPRQELYEFSLGLSQRELKETLFFYTEEKKVLVTLALAS